MFDVQSSLCSYHSVDRSNPDESESSAVVAQSVIELLRDKFESTASSPQLSGN